MIKRYFGKPGCGKTTHLVATALRENHRINTGKSKFERILTNVPITGIGEKSNIYLFDNTDFGNYDMSYSLILFDESEYEFNSRDYASLGKSRTQFLMLHRHYHTVIYFYSQTPDGVDKKIRGITDRFYYLSRNYLTGKTKATRILLDFDIPTKRDMRKKKMVTSNGNGGSTGTDIAVIYYKQGWFSSLVERLVAEPKVKLSKYYGKFDSFDCPPMPYKQYRLCGDVNV